MRKGSVLLALLLLVATFGCGGGGEGDAATAGAAASDKVAEAVAIQKEINADAGRAEQILEEHGMTIEDYEDLMAEISADPELSREFNAQLEQ